LANLPIAVTTRRIRIAEARIGQDLGQCGIGARQGKAYEEDYRSQQTNVGSPHE
jgi:hypothetical protein